MPLIKCDYSGRVRNQIHIRSRRRADVLYMNLQRPAVGWKAIALTPPAPHTVLGLPQLHCAWQDIQSQVGSLAAGNTLVMSRSCTEEKKTHQVPLRPHYSHFHFLRAAAVRHLMMLCAAAGRWWGSGGAGDSDACKASFSPFKIKNKAPSLSVAQGSRVAQVLSAFPAKARKRRTLQSHPEFFFFIFFS